LIAPTVLVLCLRTADGFVLHGRVTFLYLSKETHQKNTKGTRMLALRVPCDARMSWRGVNSLRSDKHAPKPQLILRFSASLNGI